MAFTPAGAVDAVAAQLATVSGGVGPIHKYRRLVRSLADASALLSDPGTGTLRGAYVSWSRATVRRDSGHPSSAGIVMALTITVELVRGIEDAAGSELAFRDTVFEVLQTINRKGRIYADASHQGPLEAQQIGYLQVADSLLLHYAQLALELHGRTAP